MGERVNAGFVNGGARLWTAVWIIVTLLVGLGGATYYHGEKIGRCETAIVFIEKTLGRIEGKLDHILESRP